MKAFNYSWAIFFSFQLCAVADHKLDCIIGLSWNDCTTIASNQLHAVVYINTITRNTAGSIMYIDCDVGLTNGAPKMTVVITETNIYTLPATDRPKPPFIYDNGSKEWIFSSGMHLPVRLCPHVIASSDASLIALTRSANQVEVLSHTLESVATITNLTEIRRVGGDMKRIYVIGVTRPGPKVVYHFSSLIRESGGEYKRITRSVSWINNDFDVDDNTGEVIVQERATLWPSCFIYSSQTDQRRKVRFSKEFMLFVNHGLARYITHLCPAASVQERKLE